MIEDPGELDRLLAEFPKPVAELARRTLDVVLETIGDDAHARVEHGSKAIRAGPGQRATGVRFAILPIGSGRVDLSFSHGASLPDPDGLLEGTAESSRHVPLHTAGDLESPALRDLIRAELAAG